MSSNITLSAGIRANLLSLQQTSDLMTLTQNRLATGKKVNSALDNPLNYFQSSSLSGRANDLSGLLDTMASGISTIQAANNGITAITSLVQQLKATVSQARSDATSTAATPTSATAAANTSTATNNSLKIDIGGGTVVSFSTSTHTNAVVSTITGSGAVGTDATGATLTVDDGSGSGAQTVTFAAGDTTVDLKIAAINNQLGAAGSTVVATKTSGGEVQFSNATGKVMTVTASAAIQTDLGLAATQTSTDGSPAADTPVSLSALADSINANAALSGKVTASYAAGTGLTIKNLSSSALTVTGYDGTNITGAAASTTTVAAAAAGTLSDVRKSLKVQFNDLLTQIDNAVKDAGYNGINLLNGDDLKLNFNENGTSSITIQSKDSSGAKFTLNYTNLGFTTAADSDFASNTTLDSIATKVATALSTLRTQASSLGSSLSVVQTRQDFTKSMVNTLQTGADNLVLADTNEEGANLLALQTRQSLSTTALSLSAQADQNVLRLFG
jgi:flagellin-like hook-associated protein FlgL